MWPDPGIWLAPSSVHSRGSMIMWPGSWHLIGSQLTRILALDWLSARACTWLVELGARFLIQHISLQIPHFKLKLFLTFPSFSYKGNQPQKISLKWLGEFYNKSIKYLNGNVSSLVKMSGKHFEKHMSDVHKNDKHFDCSECNYVSLSGVNILKSIWGLSIRKKNILIVRFVILSHCAGCILKNI